MCYIAIEVWLWTIFHPTSVISCISIHFVVSMKIVCYILHFNSFGCEHENCFTHLSEVYTSRLSIKFDVICIIIWHLLRDCVLFISSSSIILSRCLAYSRAMQRGSLTSVYIMHRVPSMKSFSNQSTVEEFERETSCIHLNDVV